MSLSPDRTLSAKIMAGVVGVGVLVAVCAWAIGKIGDLIL